MPSLTKKKLDEILSNLNLNVNSFKTFIETGSHMGETIDNMITHFDLLITIEISEKYYNIVKNKFNSHPKVKCHYGDSAIMLSSVLPPHKKWTIFWLDGHYSSGDTGKGIKDCPLIEELKLIGEIYEETIIIIDDYRMFGTKNLEDWTDITYENVLSCFEKNKLKKIFPLDDKLIIYI